MTAPGEITQPSVTMLSLTIAPSRDRRRAAAPRTACGRSRRGRSGRPAAAPRADPSALCQYASTSRRRPSSPGTDTRRRAGRRDHARDHVLAEVVRGVAAPVSSSAPARASRGRRRRCPSTRACRAGSAGFSTNASPPIVVVRREDSHARGLLAGHVEVAIVTSACFSMWKADQPVVVHLVDVVAREDEHLVAAAPRSTNERFCVIASAVPLYQSVAVRPRYGW